MAKKPVKRQCSTCNGTGKLMDEITIVQHDWGSDEVRTQVPYEPTNFNEKETVEKVCKNCDGRGWTGYSTNPKRCSTCKGEGHILVTEMKLPIAIRLLGSILGEHPRKCSYCNGSGVRIEMVDE